MLQPTLRGERAGRTDAGLLLGNAHEPLFDQTENQLFCIPGTGSAGRAFPANTYAPVFFPVLFSCAADVPFTSFIICPDISIARYFFFISATNPCVAIFASASDLMIWIFALSEAL